MAAFTAIGCTRVYVSWRILEHDGSCRVYMVAGPPRGSGLNDPFGSTRVRRAQRTTQLHGMGLTSDIFRNLTQTTPNKLRLSLRDV